MKKFKSLIAAFVVALLSAALILPIAACNNEEGADGNNKIYVTSLGGMALKEVTVELKKDDTSLGKKQTDNEGKVTYNLNSGTNYTVVVSDLPAGFLPNESYTVKGEEENSYIRINSQVIENDTPKRVYQRGDVMYDFEETYYTFRDGKLNTLTKKLSDFFKEGKKAVLIDFFYNTCSACNNEYPALSAAYKKYSDKLEILGINDMPDTLKDETPADLQAKVQNEQVPYLMCKDRAGESTWFKGILTGYPTAVMIDRYGIMCEYMVGNNTDQNFWETWFETYTSDNYAQNVEQGSNGEDVFTPDVPGDFNASMPTTLSTNTNINATGRPVVFAADTSNSSNGWPWDLTEDGTAIYPTNSGHKATFAVIYVQVDLKEGEVFAFDYKLSTNPKNDYFYVSLDSRLGTGRQISMQTGIQDWQTGYAYVALEDGRHEIEFSYYRSQASTSIALDDKAYVKNLRITTVEEMNADLTAKNETFEIPYFATRNYSNRDKQFLNIDSVYLADDGYYHIGTKATANELDPYLLLDITHSTPYFGSNSSNLYNLYLSSVSNGGMILDNVDYTREFASYVSYASNSLYDGMIPVTDEIRDTLTTLYNHYISSDKSYWSADGWLQFCVSYKQFGVQKKLSDPVKGLAYFSAFEAFETTNEENYIPVDDGTGQFYMDEKETEGLFVDVEGTDWEDKGNFNLNPKINEAHFDRILMPRGYLYKFVPTKSGAYSINGLDCYYHTNENDAIIDGEETDAYLYDGSLELAPGYVEPISESTSDRYNRNEVSNSFKIIYYLEKGQTYYIDVAFRVVETTGDFAFRIDYLGETYSYIHQAASGAYILDNDNHMAVPLYCDPALDDSHTYSFDGKEQQVWYDKNTGGLIWLDFTQTSALFDKYTIEQILDPNKKTAQFTFDISKEKYIDGNGKEFDISLDLLKIYGSLDKIPAVLKDLEIKDYTDIMKEYLRMSKEEKSGYGEEYYGLLPVNQELYEIIQLFNAKFTGYEADEEWLRACCFTMNVGHNK